MTSLLQWLQLASYATQIFMGVGATLFTLLVLWPSIRLQTRFIKAQETKGVDDLIDRL
jgi:hypothetical protein